MLHLRLSAGLAGLLSLLVSASPTHAQFDRLTRHVPASANAAAFINVGKLLDSPVAKKEKWAEKRDNAFSSGVSFLPPDSTHAVLAMQLDLQMGLTVWQTAILELDHDPNLAKVVEQTGGAADSVVGRDAVDLPEDAYVLKLNRSAAAFMTPANRQSVARWMKEVDARKGLGLSPYLSEAYGFANDVGTPIIMAIDLEDAISPEALREQLAESKDFLAKHKLSLDAGVKLVSSLRGVTLGVTFNDKPFGKLKVDFSENVSLSPETAKALLLYSLGNRGAMIDEFNEWKPGVKARQVTLEGSLTASGLRRIASLFDRPPSLKNRQPPADAQPQSPEQLTLAASQVYFRRISELLDDVAQKPKDDSRATIPQIGVWLDNYATKIDKLSVLNVDPELVAYGNFAADNLRGAYNVIRQGSANKRVRQVNQPMQYNYYSGGVAYSNSYRSGYAFGTVAVEDQRAYNHGRVAIRTEERVGSANSARDILQGLQQATADVRKKMTQKYKVDF